MYIFHFVYFVHFMKPLVSSKKNGVEYILSRVENIKILLNWVYTQLCWWRWFESFLSWGRPQHLSMELRLRSVLSWWRWGLEYVIVTSSNHLELTPKLGRVKWIRTYLWHHCPLFENFYSLYQTMDAKEYLKPKNHKWRPCSYFEIDLGWKRKTYLHLGIIPIST